MLLPSIGALPGPPDRRTSVLNADRYRNYTPLWFAGTSLRGDLTEGGWSNVAGEVAVQYGTGGEKTMQDTNTAARMFYSVKVKVTP